MGRGEDCCIMQVYNQGQLKMDLPWKRFHFVGIGGVGMSALAEILTHLDYKVSGSDIIDNALTRLLRNQGVKVFFGHKSEQIQLAEVVVVSSAIPKDNPEWISARENNIPVISRGRLLSYLMNQKSGIAIAGTHGKTTTSALIFTILGSADLEPTAIIGGMVNGANAWFGNGDYLVAEADESDGSFLLLSPKIVVVTNIDADHLDYYKTFFAIKAAFKEFLNNLSPFGVAVICMDDPGLKEIMPELDRPYISYGLGEDCHYQARGLLLNETTQFDIYAYGKKMGKVSLQLLGMHNVYNALAAFAVAQELGIPTEITIKGLEQFRGVDRRLAIKGEKKNILIIDDYGHHPTEIKAVFSSIKQKWPKRRLITVFQPHRFTRTKALYEGFLTAFSQADLLIITEIYAASEPPIPGVSGEWLANGIGKIQKVKFCKTLEEAFGYLLPLLRTYDIVLTLGAGDVSRLAERLLAEL